MQGVLSGLMVAGGNFPLGFPVKRLLLLWCLLEAAEKEWG